MITVSEYIMPALLCKFAALYDMDSIHGTYSTESAVRFFKISPTILNDIIRWPKSNENHHGQDLEENTSNFLVSTWLLLASHWSVQVPYIYWTST